MNLATASRSAWRGLILPGMCAALGIAFMMWLGFWQLDRLAWKQGILRRIDGRIHAAPVAPPPESAWAGFRAEDEDYRHVTASGHFLHADEALVFRASGNGRPGFDGPGYLVLTPLVLAGGEIIIVNRGFVPLARRDPASRTAGQPAGDVTITGLLRPTEPRNAFTPVDNPEKGEWFTRDPALIARHFHLARVAPFMIDADAEPGNPGGLPLGGATVLAIPNDHFSYALTWFGLACSLAGVFAVFAWKRVRETGGAQ